jgi:peptide-methionine (R)-S-oxide reductase
MSDLPRNDEEWRLRLTPDQYRILREKGTEHAFTGAYVDEKSRGVYRCAGCGAPLFTSDEKFDSGSGWPSFWDVVDEGRVELHEDTSLGMRRVEVTCATCGSHLGHLFPDGPADRTGLRYCINSASLSLDRETSPDEAKAGEGD